MDKLLLKEINTEIMKRLKRLIESGYNFNLDIDKLYEKYKLKEIYLLETSKVEKRGPHKVAETDSRCQARIWGKDPKTRVRKDEQTKKWLYGHQCSRNAKENEIYCGIHLKSLTHGNYYKDVPHIHFDKFKYNNICGE